jgi:hypothetical protein
MNLFNINVLYIDMQLSVIRNMDNKNLRNTEYVNFLLCHEMFFNSISYKEFA